MIICISVHRWNSVRKLKTLSMDISISQVRYILGFCVAYFAVWHLYFAVRHSCTDITAQWRNGWLLASVVNHDIATDLSACLQGCDVTYFIAHGRSRVAYRQNKARASQTCTRGTISQQLFVNVANSRP